MCFRLNHQRAAEDLSPAQEWLYDGLVSELEYRNRQARHMWDMCSCELCVPPFEEYLPPEP